MWFWCQAFFLDLHLNYLFKSSNIKTCQRSSARCAQHGKPHNLLFLYMWKERLPAHSLRGCHFREKTSISQGLTIHLTSNLPTYWFIFKAKINSQWSVGDTCAHFQEHFPLFPLFFLLKTSSWSYSEQEKVIKNEQSRLRHKGAFLSGVTLTQYHWWGSEELILITFFFTYLLICNKNVKVICLFERLPRGRCCP